LRRMPVEFLTDDEAAAYGRYAGVPSQADLERVFFLDDEDRGLIERRRGEHMKLGFTLQLVTVRWVGVFLEDPLEVPVVVLYFVAEQLGIADPSCVKRYTERAKTKLDHQWEIRRVDGLKVKRPGFRAHSVTCDRPVGRHGLMHSSRPRARLVVDGRGGA
jgi:TnpA family transposase